MSNQSETMKKWTGKAKEALEGKTIKEVRYLTDEEMEKMFGWHKRPLVIFFEDGSSIYPSTDDEGNDGGSLFTSFEQLPTIPTL